MRQDLDIIFMPFLMYALGITLAPGSQAPLLHPSSDFWGVQEGPRLPRPAYPSRLRSSSEGRSSFWARVEGGRAELLCRRSSPPLAQEVRLPTGRKMHHVCVLQATKNHSF